MAIRMMTAGLGRLALSREIGPLADELGGLLVDTACNLGTKLEILHIEGGYTI